MAEAPQDPAAPAKPAAKPDAKAAAAPPLPPDPEPPADTPVPAFITAVQAAVPGAVERVSYYVGDWTLIVALDRLLDVVRVLHDGADTAFDFCSDVTASDWPSRPQRFDIIYILYSTRLHHRVRVKVRAADGQPVPSVTGVWPAANWLEREVFDMFGVPIAGHPDLRRILMPEDWQGYPQRKDYPLEGPGELLLESPQEWLKLRSPQDQIE